MEEGEIVAQVVRRLRAIRKDLGISQAELSRRTGLSRSGIRHMEDGEVTPTLRFLLSISKALQTNLSEILHEFEVPEKPTSANS